MTPNPWSETKPVALQIAAGREREGKGMKEETLPEKMDCKQSLRVWNSVCRLADGSELE